MAFPSGTIHDSMNHDQVQKRHDGIPMHSQHVQRRNGWNDQSSEGGRRWRRDHGWVFSRNGRGGARWCRWLDLMRGRGLFEREEGRDEHMWDEWWTSDVSQEQTMNSRQLHNRAHIKLLPSSINIANYIIMNSPGSLNIAANLAGNFWFAKFLVVSSSCSIKLECPAYSPLIFSVGSTSWA